MTQTFRIALSLTLLTGALLVLQLRSSGEAIPLRRPLDTFPQVVDGWRGAQGALLDANTLSVLKATDYVLRRYQNPAGRNLWLFIGYWDSQRKGAQPHSPKNCLPGAGWEPVEASRVAIPLGGSFAPITVNRYLIQKDRDQQIVFYWYHSQGHAVAGELTARFELIKNSIVRHRTDGALIRVTSPVYGNVRDTSDLMAKYVGAIYPLLGGYLPD